MRLVLANPFWIAFYHQGQHNVFFDIILFDELVILKDNADLLAQAQKLGV